MTQHRNGSCSFIWTDLLFESQFSHHYCFFVQFWQILLKSIQLGFYCQLCSVYAVCIYHRERIRSAAMCHHLSAVRFALSCLWLARGNCCIVSRIYYSNLSPPLFNLIIIGLIFVLFVHGYHKSCSDSLSWRTLLIWSSRLYLDLGCRYQRIRATIHHHHCCQTCQLHMGQ